MTTTIQVRTPIDTKKRAQRVLENLGMDLSTAINIYLVQIAEKNGIPFPIVTENGFTPKQEEMMLKEIEEAKKKGKRYTSSQKMFKDILRT